MGVALRRIRRQRGWTGADMARFMGLQVAYLSNVENRRQTASPRQVLRFAESLGVAPHALLAASLEDLLRRLGVAVRVTCRPG